MTQPGVYPGGNIHTIRGATDWDGDSYTMATALNNPGTGLTPAIQQLVGQNARRRAVTVINTDTVVSIRVCRTRAKAESVGKGILLRPGGGLVIETIAEVYVANDNTTASPVVSYFEEVD